MTSAFPTASVEKGRIFWIASLHPRRGYTWSWGAPTRLGLTKRGALRRIERHARILTVKLGLGDPVSLGDT